METMVENRVADVENAKDVALTLDELVKKVWKGDVILDKGDATQYISDENSNRLMEEGIVVVKDGGRITFTRHNPVIKNVVSHKYRMPDFAGQVGNLVRRSIDRDGMVNLICTGGM